MFLDQQPSKESAASVSVGKNVILVGDVCALSKLPDFRHSQHRE
jgi:hypothetical protein